MKFTLPNLSYRAYVRYLRRQRFEVQRMHAFIFAGTITGIIAVCILYYDYGFWHDVYVQPAEPVIEEQSSGDSLDSFIGEIHRRWTVLGKEGKMLLEGKEVIHNTAPLP